MYYQGRLGPCESVTRERVHMTLCPLWGRACGMLRVMERSFGLRLRLPGAASRAGVFSGSPRTHCVCAVHTDSTGCHHAVSNNPKHDVTTTTLTHTGIHATRCTQGAHTVKYTSFMCATAYRD